VHELLEVEFGLVHDATLVYQIIDFMTCLLT